MRDGATANEPTAGGPMPPCPKCGARFEEVTNFCGHCGADLRGLGGETDTLVGALFGKIVDGRYRILKKLGEGGMGSVYQVEHTRMGKICALKVLRADLASGQALRDRFRQEARIVSRLVHPNTIQVFDFGETEDGELYLAMEYLKGRSLDQVRKDEGGRLSEARVARIAIQILRSLAEAHEAGIIHRDVKPQNVMILDLRDRKDFVKVLDFGIAKLAGARDRETTTGVGEIVGTPTYLSPEQARGEALDPRSDLYSLGALVFELLTGRAPFQADTPLGVVTAHLTQPVPIVHEVVPEVEVSPGMEAILAKALAKDPWDRYPNADAMRAALEARLGDEAPRTGAHPIPAGPVTGELDVLSRADFDRFAKRLVVRRILSAVLPLVLLAGGAGGAWAYFGRHPPPITHETEPNDDPNRANVVTPVSEPSLQAILADRKAKRLRGVTGHLGRRHSPTMGDLDWYRFDLSAPRTVYLEVTSLPNVDLVLQVLHAAPGSGGKLAVVARSDAPGVGVGEILPDLRLGAGRWLVEVREVETQRANGSVAPPVENVSDAYHLYAATYPSEGGLEIEPNDTPPEATALAPGSPAAGLPGGPGQIDWWRVATPPAGPVVARLSAVAGARLRLEVWDAKGTKALASDHGRALAGRSGAPGAAVRIVVPRAPAPTFLRVETLAATATARTTAYRITLAPAKDGRRP